MDVCILLLREEKEFRQHGCKLPGKQCVPSGPSHLTAIKHHENAKPGKFWSDSLSSLQGHTNPTSPHPIVENSAPTPEQTTSIGWIRGTLATWEIRSSRRPGKRAIEGQIWKF
ncbi:hypothetical protein AVEN_44007-1 [Araneus ventricosus]|uniref:Uncharacterized protein n=1 Tax=Araneus ventricosus TaxID=182803 RepID=A0A4Y2SL27_ARAVE|nr:hypothetical protein AVEN_44007-1 [Araneus ventricosus]